MTKRAARTKTLPQQKKSSRNSLRPVKAWAWAIRNDKGDFEFCYWAERDRKRLLASGRPSPEARALPVYITRRTDDRDAIA